jgi:hypothetical protein
VYCILSFVSNFKFVVTVIKELSQDPLSGFINFKYRGWHCHPKPEIPPFIPEERQTLMDIYNAMVNGLDIDGTHSQQKVDATY